MLEDYRLEPWHERLLIEALQSLDRAEQARRRLVREGLTVQSRLGELKSHPLLLVERDARASFARLMRQLGLDVEGAPPPSSRRSR